MPVPLPSPGDVDRVPPGPAEVDDTVRGVIGIVAPDGGLTPLQRSLVESLFEAMTGHPVDIDAAAADPLDAEALARVLARRDAVHRSRILQAMLLLELVLVPLPPEVAGRVEAASRALGVDDELIAGTRRLARGHLALAAFDFERAGYTRQWSPDAAARLGLDSSASPWDQAPANPELAARWAALEHLAPDTLGRQVWQFYRARGFGFPGTPGSAPPLLAQHDWVHVLAEFGSTVESELEVFAFIARANDHPSGFSLLAMVVNLFETGYQGTGAGFFEAAPGHLRRAGVVPRVADAMRRGALCKGSNDFLALDWFAFADRPVGEVRDHFGVRPRSERAIAAGSRGPFEAGGISPFQYAAGRSVAESLGLPYDSHGATP